jgi:hypothetical protein
MDVEYCSCGAPLAFSPDGVHCVGCYESRSARAIDVEGVARLVTRLEHERSLEACIALGEALGYTVQVEDEAVWLDHPLSRWMSIFFPRETLVVELLETGKAVLRVLGAVTE